MSFNSIVFTTNRIKEIEQNEPNSPPSITSLEQRKTIPDLSFSINSKIHIPPIQLIKRKSKSLSSSFNTKNLNDIFFSENSFKNSNSFINKKNNIDIPRLNLDETKVNKDNNTKRKENYVILDESKNNCKSNNNISYSNSNNKTKEIKTVNSNYFSAFKIYKPDSARVNSSYLKNITANSEKNLKHIEEKKEKNINTVYTRYKNKRITKYINEDKNLKRKISGESLKNDKNSTAKVSSRTSTFDENELINDLNNLNNRMEDNSSK